MHVHGTCFHVWSVATGVWGVGLATPTVQVDTVPLGGDSNSWVLTSEGTGLHNGQIVSRVRQGLLATEGDIIVSYRCIITRISCTCTYKMWIQQLNGLFSTNSEWFYRLVSCLNFMCTQWESEYIVLSDFNMGREGKVTKRASFPLSPEKIIPHVTGFNVLYICVHCTYP